MYLVDTSVWVDFINGNETPAVNFLDSILERPMDVGISEQIFMEILQGAKHLASFERLQRYFSTQNFYDFDDSRKSHQAAAFMYFESRRKGVTTRSSVDCLIAQCAIENNVTLLHKDRDFVNLGRVVPELQQKHFLV